MERKLKANIQSIVDLLIDPKSNAAFHCTGRERATQGTRTR